MQVSLNESGWITGRVKLPAGSDDNQRITRDWWINARQEILEEVFRVEAMTGTAAPVIATGAAALVAIHLALEGQLDAVVGWQPDLRLSRQLDTAWRAERGRFELSAETLLGDYDAIQQIRVAIGQTRSRRLPAPVLLISDITDLGAVDRHWFSDTNLRHSWLTVNAGGDVAGGTQAGWQLADTVHATTDWLRQHPVRDLMSCPRGTGLLLRCPAPTLTEGRGAVFISYRHAEPDESRAQEVKHWLDVVGIRSFVDKFALSTGDILSVVDRAINEDCGGGVLILTENTASSDFIKRYELPRLLAHAERHGMTLSIDNRQLLPDGRVDTDLAGKLNLPLDITQYDMGGCRQPCDHDFTRITAPNYGIDDYITHLLNTIVEPLSSSPVYLDVQTYDLDGDIRNNKNADLRIRVLLDMRPTAEASEHRRESLIRLQRSFRLLGQALHASSPERIIITGGGLAPFGVALGGMLCSTRIKCPVIIEDNFGPWGLPAAPNPNSHTVRVQQLEVVGADPASGRIAVLVAGPKTNPELFETMVSGLSEPVAGAIILNVVNTADTDPNTPDHINYGEGAGLAAMLAKTTTAFAEKVSTGSTHTKEILLCFALGFPLGVLLGRELNKYRVVCYDLLKGTEQWYRRLLELDPVDSQVSQVFVTDPLETEPPTKYL